MTRATLEVVELAVDERRREQLPRYVARTMREAFCEAFFGQSALVVEGITDVGVMTQVGRLMGFDLASHGVVVVPVSKGDQPVALAVLRALEIPTYVAFDAGSDAVDTEACPQCGRQEQKRRAKEQNENEAILHTLGAPLEPFPCSGARAEWACFEADLEQFLAETMPDFDQQKRTVADEMGWKMKSPKVYAEVLERLGREALPDLLTEIVRRALGSAGVVVQRESIARARVQRVMGGLPYDRPALSAEGAPITRMKPLHRRLGNELAWVRVLAGRLDRSDLPW